MALHDFLSDVSTGFSGANSALGVGGQNQATATPGPLPVYQTPYGSAAAVTLPTHAPPAVTNPVITQNAVAGFNQPGFNTHLANYMDGNGANGLPGAMWTTTPSMGVYRGAPQMSPGPLSVTPSSSGFTHDMMAGGMMSPYWGVNAGIRRRPLGMGTMDANTLAATNNVNRAMTATYAASTLAMATAGAFGGDFMGTAIGGGIGAWAGGAIGSALGPLGMAAGAWIGRHAGGFIGGAVGGTAGLFAAKMNPFSAVMDRRVQALNYHAMTRGLITSGNSLDVSGTGLSQLAAQQGVRGMYSLAADDAVFTRRDFTGMTDAAGSSGLLNMINSPQEMKRRMGDVAKAMRVFMDVANDPDMRSALKSMGELYNAGVSLGGLNQAASNIKQFARMAGVTVDEAMSTSGAQGGYMYKQMGLTQGAGIQAGVAGQGLANTLVQTGALTQADVNRMGGVTGIGQGFTQAGAGFLGRGSSPFLPGLLKAGPGGSVSVDPNKIAAYLSGKLDMNSLMNDQGMFGGAQGYDRLQYMLNNQSKLQADLADQLGPRNTQLMIMRLIQDTQRQLGSGTSLQSAARVVTGDTDSAYAYSQLMSNPEALRTLQQQSLLERRQLGLNEYNAFSEQQSVLERNINRPWRRFWSGMGSRMLSPITDTVASFEDSLRAESAGMYRVNNPAAGFYITGSQGGGSLGGALPYNQDPHWYSIGAKPLDKVLYRSRGMEGVSTFLAGAFRGGGSGFIGNDKQRLAMVKDLRASAGLLEQDMAEDEVAALTGKLNKYGGAGRVLSVYVKAAKAAGKDRAAFTVGDLSGALESEFGSGITGLASDIYRYGAAAYTGVDEVDTALGQTRFSAGAIEGLGTYAGSLNSFYDDAEARLDKEFGTWKFGKKDVKGLQSVSTFLRQNGVKAADYKRIANLLGRALDGDADATSELMKSEGTSRLLRKARSDVDLKSTFRSLRRNRSRSDVGRMFGAVEDILSAGAEATLLDKLGGLGIDKNAYSSASRADRYNMLRNNVATLGPSSSDEDVRGYLNSLMNGVNASADVGGVVQGSASPIQATSDKMLNGLIGAAQSWRVNNDEFGKHVNRFRDAVDILATLN